MIQIKNTTERLDYTKLSITRMNLGKVKFDEMLQIGLPTGVKTGYVSEKSAKYVEGESSILKGVFGKEKLTSTERKRMIDQLKFRRPPIICSYCMLIGHVWNPCYGQSKT